MSLGIESGTIVAPPPEHVAWAMARRAGLSNVVIKKPSGATETLPLIVFHSPPRTGQEGTFPATSNAEIAGQNRLISVTLPESGLPTADIGTSIDQTVLEGRELDPDELTHFDLPNLDLSELS